MLIKLIFLNHPLILYHPFSFYQKHNVLLTQFYFLIQDLQIIFYLLVFIPMHGNIILLKKLHQLVLIKMDQFFVLMIVHLYLILSFFIMFHKIMIFQIRKGNFKLFLNPLLLNLILFLQIIYLKIFQYIKNGYSLLYQVMFHLHNTEIYHLLIFLKQQLYIHLKILPFYRQLMEIQNFLFLQLYVIQHLQMQSILIILLHLLIHQKLMINHYIIKCFMFELQINQLFLQLHHLYVLLFQVLSYLIHLFYHNCILDFYFLMVFS